MHSAVKNKTSPNDHSYDKTSHKGRKYI